MPEQLVCPVALKASTSVAAVTKTVVPVTVGLPKLPDADHSGWQTFGVPEQLCCPVASNASSALGVETYTSLLAMARFVFAKLNPVPNAPVAYVHRGEQTVPEHPVVPVEL